MPTHLGATANSSDNKSPSKKVPTATQFDKPPKLPGLDSPKCEKEVKTVFNKFKVKILFTVPEHVEIKPRDKFATLFSVLQQQHKETLLEQRDTEATEQAQSIISGADLQHDNEQLSIYCPHVWRNTCLNTLWRLQSTA
eukprot:14792458-Ditylum_brightwellii.AAC.1